jgi:hypothetical protein
MSTVINVQRKRSNSRNDVLFGLAERRMDVAHKKAISSKAPMPNQNVKWFGESDRL